MDPNLGNVSQALVQAVNVAMDPLALPGERRDAFKVCEEFKETSVYCVPCGVLLVSSKYPDIIRHFGLQLLEHAVKFRWNELSDEEQQYMKATVMQLVASGTNDLLVEPSFIKNALVKIVVELVKRLWPQKWNKFLSDLNDITKLGATQEELVFLILLRLTEDVIQFQTVPPKRRRDITQGFTNQLPELYPFFIENLRKHITAYEKLKSSPMEGEINVCKSHCKVAQAILNALTGFVDWINLSYITDNDGLLLKMLCVLLSDNNLQLHAADVLLIIVSRKGKAEERKPLLMLFSEEAMSMILNSAEQSAVNISSGEYYYGFLKKLGQVLTATGAQLTYLWGNPDGVTQRPDNFAKYLDAILALTHHPSQVLASYTYTLLASFLRHEHISQDPSLHNIIPRLMEIACTSLIKVGYPSHDNHVSCRYSRYDFDSDEDFNIFYSRFRAEVYEVVRQTTIICPMVTFKLVVTWLQTLLSKPVDLGDGADSGHCNLSSPSFLEWEAMSVFLDSSLSKWKHDPNKRPLPEDGLKLLKAVLSYNTQDPLILSCLLSCISALFAFLRHATDMLSQVLNRIFSTVTFNLPGQTKGSRSKAVKNVRRHACSIIVRTCKLYPDLLLPSFDQLYSHINSMSTNPELSQMEKCTLMEGLILISNEFKDFERQSNLIMEILSPIKSTWLSDSLQIALGSTEKFMTFIGLDQAPVEPSSADTCGINRSHISNCVNTILAVMKRSKWPECPEKCKKGGFVISIGSTEVLRNPATSHIMNLLENLLSLLRIMNSLQFPQHVSRRHPSFENAYELHETEKLNILGIQPLCIDNTDVKCHKQPLERMQNFITNSYGNSFHILGNAGQCLGYEFYSVPNIAGLLQYCLDPVFTNEEYIPDYRIKPIIRVFLKPYIQNCPKECYETAVLPLLSAFCPFMLKKLEVKWQAINQRSQEGTELEDSNVESQEVLEDQLTRQVTREYIDLLAIICYSRKHDSLTDENIMDDSTDNYTAAHQSKYIISELGQKALENEVIALAVTLTLFHGLCWNDTITCIKCVNLCMPVIKQIKQMGNMTGEAANHMFTCILFGLQQHGEHESCQPILSLALSTYELLRPDYVELREVLLQIPDCTEEIVKAADEKLLVPVTKQMSEKKRKELMKNIVFPIIGTNIGQKFKRELKIEDLPRLSRRRKKRDNTEIAGDIGLAALFEPDSPDS